MRVHISFSYVASSPDLLRLIEACGRQARNDWETSFVASVRKRRYPPTGKQLLILRRMACAVPSYGVINAAARPALPEVLARWLPGGKIIGREYVVRNPKRSDRSPGSFCVNIETGKWADFATDDAGGDVIALAAWLFGLRQPEAARRVAAMVGMSIGETLHG